MCAIKAIQDFSAYLCAVQELQSTYTSIDQRLFSHVHALAMPAPAEFLFNAALAEDMGLSSLIDSSHRAAILSGQKNWGHTQPFAQAYAGHQFGHFTILGDGRALVLGEWINPDGQRVDIQLKGAGPTPYSRRGDGLATVSAMLREYLISECMHGLGIPTTRSLAVVATGMPVYREEAKSGAVLTRIAKSHIRVGTFEYAAQLQDLDLLKRFTHYTIQRHYPQCLETEHPIESFLREVVRHQAELIVQWMRVGFVHGVMNTDNMSIAGETIDYGPCAFMNGFDWGTVFSSIDTQGRYAYGRQAPIAQWNLAVLASALLPVLHSDSERAVEIARECINTFVPIYEEAYVAMMRNKLGLLNPIEGDLLLIDELNAWMQQTHADFTLTFHALEDKSQRIQDIFYTAEFEAIARQLNLLKSVGHEDAKESVVRMQQHNPRFIPRNAWVEEALEKAVHDDHTLFNQLLEAGSQPYEQLHYLAHLYTAPEDQPHYKTFCGT